MLDYDEGGSGSNLYTGVIGLGLFEGCIKISTHLAWSYRRLTFGGPDSDMAVHVSCVEPILIYHSFESVMDIQVIGYTLFIITVCGGVVCVCRYS